MKKLLVAVVVLLLCFAAVNAQTTTGTITADETWSGTVTLTGDIVITGGTVTIDPGTIVKFATTNDNIVNGGASRIHIIISGDGAMSAVGTAGSRITFTSSSPLAAAGAWGKVEMWQLNNTNTQFKYCDFIFGQTSLEFRNATGQTAISNVTIDNCTITKNSASCIYITSGANVDISNCQFLDCGKGVFVHGSGDVNITYCTFSKMSNAIINAGLDGYEAQKITMDHCTIYNVDMMIASTPKWWDGYGIFNTPNEITPTQPFTLTNSILVQSTLANLIANGWTTVENNNCFYTGLLGLMNYEDGTPDATDIVGDFSSPVSPLFTDGDNFDFTLAAGSPCIGAGTGGSNMGAWDAAGIYDLFGAAGADLGFEVLTNPMTSSTAFRVADGQNATFEVFNMDGRQVRRLEGSGMVSWDGRQVDGSRADAGMYTVVCRTSAGSTAGRLMVAE